LEKERKEKKREKKIDKKIEKRKGIKRRNRSKEEIEIGEKKK
jgi:hypothetical protein